MKTNKQKGYVPAECPLTCLLQKPEMNLLCRNSKSSQVSKTSLVSMWKLCSRFALILHIIHSYVPCEAAIKHVQLTIDPVPVRRSHQATIQCQYDQSIPLFSVKLYRGLREFYRYSPHESPQNKYFPFPGINVDMTQSNETQVVLKNVGFGLAGNFSCEVTADAPLFSTGTAYAQMKVVELPTRKPTIAVESNYYEPGDVLRANCSSPQSRPKTELVLTLNNQVLYEAESLYLPGIPETLLRTETSVRLHLQSSHFRNSGALVLRCTARIDNFYENHSEVTIRTPSSRDPVPERVTYTSSSYRQNIIKSTLLISVMVFILSR